MRLNVGAKCASDGECEIEYEAECENGYENESSAECVVECELNTTIHKNKYKAEY